MSSSRFRAWPITETTALLPMLHEMGLKLPASEIDGTSGSADALSDAMVSVGPAGRGGTGSFISSDGLIITNHQSSCWGAGVGRVSACDVDTVCGWSGVAVCGCASEGVFNAILLYYFIQAACTAGLLLRSKHLFERSSTS